MPKRCSFIIHIFVFLIMHTLEAFNQQALLKRLEQKTAVRGCNHKNEKLPSQAAKIQSTGK